MRMQTGYLVQMLSYLDRHNGAKRRFPLNGRGLSWKNKRRSMQKLAQIKTSLLRQLAGWCLYFIMSSKFTTLNALRNQRSSFIIFSCYGSKTLDENNSCARDKQQGKLYWQDYFYICMVLLTKTLSLLATLITSFSLLIITVFTSLITNSGISFMSSYFSTSEFSRDICNDFFILAMIIKSSCIQLKSWPLCHAISTSMPLASLLSIFVFLYPEYRYLNVFATRELKVSISQSIFFTHHSNQSQAFNNIKFFPL